MKHVYVTNNNVDTVNNKDLIIIIFRVHVVVIQVCFL